MSKNNVKNLTATIKYNCKREKITVFFIVIFRNALYGKQVEFFNILSVPNI